MLNKSDRVTVGRAAVLLVVVASINALVSTGFATAYLFASPSDPTAGYALVRAVVLAVVLVVAVLTRSATAIMVSGLALTLAQVGDAGLLDWLSAISTFGRAARRRRHTRLGSSLPIPIDLSVWWHWGRGFASR